MCHGQKSKIMYIAILWMTTNPLLENYTNVSVSVMGQMTIPHIPCFDHGTGEYIIHRCSIFLLCRCVCIACAGIHVLHAYGPHVMHPNLT